MPLLRSLPQHQPGPPATASALLTMRSTLSTVARSATPFPRSSASRAAIAAAIGVGASAGIRNP